MYKINHADIKDWAKNYDGPLFDAILCDPPYELGFMGKSWDSSGIAFDQDMWADIYKLLKPGGHLLAFSGSRTYHRMAVAIEDAGFEIRDMIEWVYGSGFPKSLNIGKAVDKIQGNEREVTGSYFGAVQNPNSVAGGLNASPNADANGRTTVISTKGNSPYEGYGTALKPAHEPCVLARKPLDKGMTVANNVLKHGTGGLNIDGTRVGYVDDNDKAKGTPASLSKDRFTGTSYNGGKSGHLEVMHNQSSQGRFPANLIHDGSDEVEAVFPQTGKSSGGRIGNKGSMINTMGNAYEKGDPGFGDSGSASRYFKVCKDLVSDTPASCSEKTYDVVGLNGTKAQPGLYYTAKSSKSERNAGLEGFDNHKPMYESHRPNYENTKGIETPYAGAGRTGNANQNHHPTVKPLSLTKYLATLIKPPTGGRLLVPFSGSGSEMIGALQAGWEYVEGVELTEEYIPIAEARIKYWQNIPHKANPKPKSAKKTEPVQIEQQELLHI